LVINCIYIIDNHHKISIFIGTHNETIQSINALALYPTKISAKILINNDVQKRQERQLRCQFVSATFGATKENERDRRNKCREKDRQAKRQE
jgi:hypothetical protein